ncbi:ATP-binding protein [Geodermatophilus sp. DSM 44513]|uniref:sensor histidine kinase n=1 Tax=Geodermatophilus sp. DSM 44513 TaxID=1528104 RepID=UPI0012878920|nr:ATP-binding protein [Geodermatophilus sp. DSM 44513]WNV76708.1 ATP-binding protein [Geodermatophilus sp. DSM 44513]
MSTEHIRFAPDILRRLGEELVPHADLGILELVRNAYDADASYCRISLEAGGAKGSAVLVADDGDGMSPDDIRNGWLLLGKSGKSGSRFSRAGRQKVGEKGLGRLAALRLGHSVILATRPRFEGAGLEYRLRIDWADFDDAKTVEEVPLSAVSSRTAESPGTNIRIEDLRANMSTRDVERLARSLVLLMGPFPDSTDFRVTLAAPGFDEMERLVRESYFTEYDYLVAATLDDEGRASATLKDWRGNIVGRAGHERVADRRLKRDPTYVYSGPQSRFEMFLFNLSKANFDVRQSYQTVDAVRQWLKVVGGVHLFHRGLRVHPYGDPGHDWLDLNLSRVKNPELRPGTNTSVGRIVVEQDSESLVPKTDRTGFIENETFTALRLFAQDVLDWAADVRLKLREAARQDERTERATDLEVAAREVEDVLSKLPSDVRPGVRKVVSTYQSAAKSQLKSVSEDLELYRSLGTVGTTSAVFAHETLRPVAIIEQMAGSLEHRARADLPDRFEQRYANPLGLIRGSVASLRTFAELPLRMLTRSKRRPGAVCVYEVIADVAEMFKPYLDDASVVMRVKAPRHDLEVRGSVAGIEAILLNMLANSVHAMNASGVPSDSRIIEIRLTSSSDEVVLEVMDSGPGIVGLEPEEVFLPGRTTREDGTGLGLTIVRDVVRDLGGRLAAAKNGSLGGAHFTVRLPMADSSDKSPARDFR